jgi:hypothetical protein
MDDLTFLSDPIDVEVASRLAAFAEARLTPSLEATARVRNAVMQAAQRQLMSAEAGRPAAAATAAPAARNVVTPRSAWQTWRGPMVAVLVGCLVVGVAAGAVWSTRPGGAMYAARLWAEMATLPTQPIERAKAEVARLQARIDEAQQASASGDEPAVEAALLAYSSIVVEAAQGVAGDPVASATIEASVELHLVVLTQIADAEPAGPARAAAVRALTASTKVVDDLRGPGGRTDPPASPGARGPADTAVDGARAYGFGLAREGDSGTTTGADPDPAQNEAGASNAADADADADAARTTRADREDKAPKGGGAPAAPTEPPGQSGTGSSHTGGPDKQSDCAPCPESKP